MHSFSTIFSAALALTPLVTAHCNIPQISGDAGGNGTGLGIMGAAVAQQGENSQTERDTAVFNGPQLMTDGCGNTNMGGNVLISKAMTNMVALSGATIPQAKNALSGTIRAISSDGCGPIKAALDTSGQGNFKNATELDVTSNIPGTNGNCPASMSKGNNGKRSLWGRALVATGIIKKRANPVNQSFNLSVAIPAGTKCTGTVNGMTGVCMVKIANANNGQSWGGCVPMQMAGAGNTATGAAAATASGKAQFVKPGKRQVFFQS